MDNVRPTVQLNERMLADIHAVAEREHGRRGGKSFVLRSALQHWIARRLPPDQIQDAGARMLAEELTAELDLLEQRMAAGKLDKLLPILRRVAGLPLVEVVGDRV